MSAFGGKADQNFSVAYIGLRTCDQAWRTSACVRNRAKSDRELVCGVTLAVVGELIAPAWMVDRRQGGWGCLFWVELSLKLAHRNSQVTDGCS
jgi:hypothetical protein